MTRSTGPGSVPGTATTVVAIAASSGGLHALATILNALPADFPAAVLVVQHMAAEHPSHLADILAWHTRVRVQAARPGQRLQPGAVYVARPGVHLTVTPRFTIALTSTPAEHFTRPSADQLFHSVAIAYGPRAVALVLTGKGEDGAAGVRQVKRAGGAIIVEDPATSEFPGMPEAAIRTGDVDYVLPLDAIADCVIALVAKLTEPGQ